MQRYNESVAAYNDLFVVQVNHPEDFCNQGYAYIQIEETEKAIVSYQKCADLDPLDIRPWNSIGLAYMSLGRYEDALTAFDQATRVSVTNATVWNNKGKALVALERPADALRCFEKALGIDPDFTEAQTNRDSMQGQLQPFSYSETQPMATATINRLGTYWTTATPVMTEVPATAATIAVPGETMPVDTGVTTVPVSNRTTYSPLSPLTALAAFLVVAVFAAWRCAKK
jgi:tetratricopeptide (TPR) repeat protein